MANAKKKRDRKFPQTEFEIDMPDAVAALMHPQDVEPADQWHFHADGEVLRITRIRATEELPVDPDPPLTPATPAARTRARPVR
jgi:hypothetical protein